MLKFLFKCLALLLLLNSCGGLVHPGIISAPHLKEEGDLQLALQLTRQGETQGGQGHFAYALTDEWGVLGAWGFLSSQRRIELLDRDVLGFYELGVIRKLGSASDQPFNTVSLQAGFGQSLHSIFNRYRQSLTFNQNLLYLQANNRHVLSKEVAVNFGLRLGASSVRWINRPVSSEEYENSNIERAVVYLDFQPVFLTATPIMQVESLFSNVIVTFTVQPSYVLNQRFIQLPASPINLGIRWNLKS